MHRVKKLISLAFCLLLALSVVSSALSDAAPWRPESETDAQRKALSLFCFCAFHPEYPGGTSDSLLHRWEPEREITLWLGGSPTQGDREKVDTFLLELQEKVPHLPPIRRVRMDTEADIRIWFVPERMLPFYLTDYVEGNWGYFHYQWVKHRIVSARIGIATDVTEQEDRNHLIMEELVGALGLPGDHEVYSDSILYEPWTTVQQLSDVDWRMLNMLYHPVLTCGMTEEQARSTLISEYHLD